MWSEDCLPDLEVGLTLPARLPQTHLSLIIIVFIRSYHHHIIHLETLKGFFAETSPSDARRPSFNLVMAGANPAESN